MKRKNKKIQKRGSNSLNKLSLFQKPDGKFSKKCPLSNKNAPIIDYKNVSLLKKYVKQKKLIQRKFPQNIILIQSKTSIEYIQGLIKKVLMLWSAST